MQCSLFLLALGGLFVMLHGRGIVGYKRWGEEVAISQQMAKSFQHSGLLVLKSSTLPTNSPKWGISSPKCCIFVKKKLSDKKIFFQQPKT